MLLPPASLWMASLILQTTRTDFAWGCSQMLTATPPLRTLGDILAKVSFGCLHQFLCWGSGVSHRHNNLRCLPRAGWSSQVHGISACVDKDIFFWPGLISKVLFLPDM